METKSDTQSVLASRPKPGSREQDLIAIVQSLVRELHPERVKFIDVTPSSRLQQDLGIDSLGRMELILRIERAFQRRLPVAVMGEANTVGDILAAIEQVQTVAAPHAPIIPEQPSLPTVAAAAAAARTLIEVLDWHLAQHPDRRHLMTASCSQR